MSILKVIKKRDLKHLLQHFEHFLVIHKNSVKTMETTAIFEILWKQYTKENPSAGRIHELFRKRGERVVNDHIAFRTFNDPRTGIDVLATPFLEAGYQPRGEYRFEAKKLRARHYELPGQPDSPRVFISELLLEEVSADLQRTVKDLIDGVPPSVLKSPDLIFRGSVFGPLEYGVYHRLREESEYAAWLYVFGFRANHFTVSINHLEQFGSIQEVNEFLKSNGFPMNSSGGEVKGTPEQLLEQSSTLADQVEVQFSGGSHLVPGCYYEFARRYRDTDGKLFSGFIAGSADKIFESTDYRS
jgi:hypothetical protein